MADAPISGLPETTTVGDNDLILLQQSNTAKKISGRNWKQYFNANVVSADASAIDPTDPPAATYDNLTNNLHLDLPTGDYFVSCEKTGSVGDTDTYTLTSALGHTATFQVVNGTGGSPSDTAPEALGTASAGISAYYSRADHVHPKPTPNDINALDRLGRYPNVNPVTDLNDFVTGIGLFNDNNGTTVDNFPYNASTETAWASVEAFSDSYGTSIQIAHDLYNWWEPRTRHQTGGTWGAWAAITNSATALKGAVPVASGGTGVTTLAGIKSLLDIEDSGWIEVTFTADFKNYGTTNKCQYRKVGNVVTVCGAATPVSDIAGSNDQVTICTLPSGYRPKTMISAVCQGSGICTWQLQVSTAGGVTFSRYRDNSGLATATSGTWLPFYATFIVS